MERPDERDQRIRELEERLSRLSRASLRITEDLDYNTVLQGVLDSARTLAGARYGAITLVDDSLGLQDVFFSGVTEQEARQFRDLPGGEQLLRYFSELPGSFRVADLNGHLRSLGLPELGPPTDALAGMAFLLAPITNRGERVGYILLGGKLGEGEGEREFSQEDEETLVLFAAQAAMAIANAGRHREEQRARADLETLIDTSPVGVVVFDAVTGTPKSFNREARRIVDSLRNTGQSPEDLLTTVSFRRADGRVVSLRELPLAQALSAGETVRAEQIVIQAPNGSSVTTLINATPIRSEEGAVESMVVTIQDMADVEEMERMRAEFLAMVSHELRAPLTSIKGSAATVLDSPTDLDPAVVRQFFRIIGDQADHMHALVGDLLDVARIETGMLPVNPEPAEVSVLVDRARSAFSSLGGPNPLAIDIEPDLPLVMADRRRIVQVLGNLISNAARHSPEASVISVSAVKGDVQVALSVTDAGRGIPAESLPHLFRKFSRVQAEEQGGDTGLGLAICKGIVEAHGGRIWAESDGPGLGARFTFTLPAVEAVVPSTAGRRAPTANRSRRRGRRDSGELVRVLAVDDDPNDLRYVRDTLTESGYAPVVTGDPDEAVRLMKEEPPDLVLLDLLLPGADGIEVMKTLLDVADVPVIFLSAYGRDEIVARAFEMGAVDYVVKPFSPTELSARIKAALRRRYPAEPSEPYVLGDLTVDYAQRRVTLAGNQVQLTPREYGILAELSTHAGQVLSHGHLLIRVWGDRTGTNLRPMRTMVSKLRRKLGDNPDNPTYIFTESRVGFRMPRGEGRSVEPVPESEETP